MDSMAAADLLLSTMRVRQSTLSAPSSSAPRRNPADPSLFRDAPRVSDQAQSAKLDAGWGLRAVMQDLDRYVSQYLPIEVEDIKLDARLFWSTFGQRRRGTARRPMKGKTSGGSARPMVA
jgi:hypothetical protein